MKLYLHPEHPKKTVTMAHLFFTVADFKLNMEILMKKTVSDWLDCVMECADESCCRSVNYNKALRNEPNCELLHDIIYNASEKVLEKNSSYDYVYLTDPHKVRLVNGLLL